MPGEQIPIERHAYKSLAIYEVSADELDGLERFGTALSGDMNIANSSGSIFITLLVTLLSTHPTPDRVYYTMLMIMLFAGILALFSGGRYWSTSRERGALIRKIRERVGPLGEEGKEVQPRELAKVPSQEHSQP